MSLPYCLHIRVRTTSKFVVRFLEPEVRLSLHLCRFPKFLLLLYKYKYKIFLVGPSRSRKTFGAEIDRPDVPKDD